MYLLGHLSANIHYENSQKRIKIFFFHINHLKTQETHF